MRSITMPGPRVRFSRQQLEEAIASSRSWSEALRRLGYRPAGGNGATVRKYAARWGISTEHFDPYHSQRGGPGPSRRPLDEILVEGSTYTRSHLKRRLYDAGLKEPICEMCGQDELRRGETMAMILDHINGVHDDNRLENLRMVCPNCAATLHTHCGRKNLSPRPERSCARCGAAFRPKYAKHRYCSLACGTRWDRRGVPRPSTRKVERPPYEQLLTNVQELGYRATGRMYGVSDNAIRKWLRECEGDRPMAEAA